MLHATTKMFLKTTLFHSSLYMYFVYHVKYHYQLLMMSVQTCISVDNILILRQC